MADVDTKKIDSVGLTVQLNSIIGSQFAQVANVSVTDTEITLQFVYINPVEPKLPANVVARVTMPIMAGEELIKAVRVTIDTHSKKKENITKKI